MKEQVTITQNDNGYHIHKREFWYLGDKVKPLLKTLHSIKECKEWLNDNFGKDGYEILSIT